MSIFDENLIPFSDATDLIPGIRVSVRSLHRWRQGLADGRCLEAAKVGGRWFTSREALLRFVFYKIPDPGIRDAVYESRTAWLTAYLEGERGKRGK